MQFIIVNATVKFNEFKDDIFKHAILVIGQVCIIISWEQRNSIYWFSCFTKINLSLLCISKCKMQNYTIFKGKCEEIIQNFTLAMTIGCNTKSKIIDRMNKSKLLWKE